VENIGLLQALDIESKGAVGLCHKDQDEIVTIKNFSIKFKKATDG
jgi:hypothetical protein